MSFYERNVFIVFQAEAAQKLACEKFDQMSDKGKEGKFFIGIVIVVVTTIVTKKIL